MRTTRVLSWVLVLCVLLGGVAMAAEPQVYYHDLMSGRVTLNEASNTLTLETDGVYTLTDVAGNALTTERYISMDEDYDYAVLEVALQSGLNVLGIIDEKGEVLVPCQYGKIDVVNDEWQVGLVLEQVTEGDYDFTNTYDKEIKYLITQVDCYHNGEVVGNLDRLQYDYMEAYGDYLYVTGDGGSGCVLSKKYGLITYDSGFYYSQEYDDGWHYGSNQEAFVPGCTLQPDEVAVSVCYTDGGNYVDLQGNMIHDGGSPYQEFSNAQVYGDYFVTYSNGKYGVADLQGNEILPAVYDEIAHTVDDNCIFASGYQLVVKDGRVGYVDMQGNEVAGFQYDVDDDSVQGFLYNPNFCCIENMGKFIVITPTAGELAEKYDDVSYAYAGQKYLVVEKDDQRGVIDMNGNVVIPFCDTYFYMSDDGTICYSSGNADNSKYYTWYYFPEEEKEEASASAGNGLANVLAAAAAQNAGSDETETPVAQTAPADDGSWNCEGCGTANSGKFCTECGAAKPAQQSGVCASCGYTLEEGQTAKFCPECGSAF